MTGDLASAALVALGMICWFCYAMARLAITGRPMLERRARPVSPPDATRFRDRLRDWAARLNPADTGHASVAARVRLEMGAVADEVESAYGVEPTVRETGGTYATEQA